MDLITVIRKDNLAFDFRISVVVDGRRLIDLLIFSFKSLSKNKSLSVNTHKRG